MIYWTTAVGGENADAVKRINEGREKKGSEAGAQKFDVKQNKNILYNLYLELPQCGTVGDALCWKTFST